MWSDSHAHDVQKSVRIYLTVFFALLILTVVTVWVSYLHLPLAGAITVALIIATVKAGLVAGWFMHLISEQKSIYVVLIFSAIFFVAMISLFLLGDHDLLKGTVVVP